MKISLLLPDLRGGGAERVSLDLAREFTHRGHVVEFVLMRAEGAFLSEAQEAFSVVNLGVSRGRHVPGALARYLRQHQPDAVIANMWPITAYAVLGRLLSQTRPRLLLMEHNTLSKQYQSWGRLHNTAMRLSMRLFYRAADVIGAVSEGAAMDTSRLAGLSIGKVKVLHNPIHPRPPPSDAALEQAETYWGDTAGKRILTVGSFKAQKNHALLLRAFAMLAHPQAKLMFLGQGKTEATLRALALELGVSEQVIFGGFHPDPTPFYRTADLFVLSSDYEGLANVLIEALSCGLPVVSTDCPSGPSEILENGRYGRLVPVGDAAALAQAMEAALASCHDPEKLKRRAADFAPNIAAQRYLALLFSQETTSSS